MSGATTFHEREILLGFWKAHILHHAEEGPLVGNWMLQELRSHGYEVSPGTLYPLLHRMERHGWLRCEVQGAGPRARRSYYLTPAGRKVLELVRAQVKELYRELVVEEPLSKRLGRKDEAHGRSRRRHGLRRR